MKKLIFPYPNIVYELDQYYGVKTNFTKQYKLDKESFNPQTKIKKGASSGKKRLSILIATFWNYPHTGGLSNYITTLRDGLEALGHKVTIISPNQFYQSNVQKIRDIIVPELKNFFNVRYGGYSTKILQSKRLLFIYEYMLKNMDLDKYDIFHAQDLFTANVLGRINQSYNKPLFFTPHGMYTRNRVKFNRIEKGSVEEVYYTEMEKKAIEYASHLIIISDSFVPPLRSLGAKTEDMTTILTGINFDRVTTTKKNRSKIVISCIARLGPRKGQLDLLEAIANLKRYRNKIDVLIVGDGEMRSTLEEKINKLRLSNVYMLGNRDDVPNILSITDIFVLPTLNDSLPLSIIEAMHSGSAVIGTNVGGIPELIDHNKTGILVEPGDVDELTKALNHLISSESSRKAFGLNAYAFAQRNLTSEAMIQNILTKYQQF